LRSEITCRPCPRDDVRPSLRRGSDGHDRPLRPTQCKTCAVKAGGRGEVGGVVVGGALVDERVEGSCVRPVERWREWWNGSRSCVATALQCSVADDAAASFDARDSHRREAGSSSGEGSPWAEQEVLAGSPAGRTSTITTRQKFWRADPGLEAGKRGWNWLRRERSQLHPVRHLRVMPHMDMTASKWGTYGRRVLGALQAPEMTVRRGSPGGDGIGVPLRICAALRLASCACSSSAVGVRGGQRRTGRGSRPTSGDGGRSARCHRFGSTSR
jgi:hypothetical protein